MSNARRPITTAHDRQLTSPDGRHFFFLVREVAGRLGEGRWSHVVRRDERQWQAWRVLVDSRCRRGCNRRVDEAEAMTGFARTPGTQRNRFAEVLAEAVAKNQRRVAALTHWEPTIAGVIEACRSDAPCGDTAYPRRVS